MGAALALALSRMGVPVALMDQRGEPSSARRPVALSCASRQILSALGVWSRVAPSATPIVGIHVSQRGCFGTARLRAAEQGVEALGWVSDVRTLVTSLDEVLAKSPGVMRFSSTSVVRAAHGPHGVRLELAGAAAEAGRRSIEVDAAVVADGGQAAWCAGSVETLAAREYRQAALGALVRAERAHGCVAYERFTPEGPIALLPKGEKDCVLVWTLAPGRAEAMQGVPEATFLAELHRAFGDRLGLFLEVRHRDLASLRRVRRRAAPGTRLFLAGNAANTVHPVAGQGLNLGLRDAAALAEVFADTLRGGGDPGSPACAERYRRHRRHDQDRVSRATDLLARAFLPRLGPVAGLRGAALVALDLAGPVKREFTRHAMGLGRPVSRMARGLAP